ncbi:MAG: ECF transporter S component [Ruminococcaceae bacterium]|nr:ECF transporter S component [Oscillospiraceae bacterium]
MNEKIKTLVRAALFAALTCIMTLVIQIPAPTGHVNLGDVGVLLSALALGPLWGGAAAGVGSALADLLSWPAYAPATFVIKFAMAAAAALIFRVLKKRGRKYVGMSLGAVAAELIMVGGYFVYECAVLAVGAAAVASIPFNLVQGSVGAVVGVTAAVLLDRGGMLNRQ